MKNFIGWNPQKFSPANLSPFTVAKCLFPKQIILAESKGRLVVIPTEIIINKWITAENGITNDRNFDSILC